jgi:CubicO group peptidase (beta-lactamase class C family)
MGELYRCGQFNGAVLVADREGIIYRGAFGFANQSSNVAFTPDTPSCLASLSKPLTALAVMMLAEKGSIKYDDAISEYIRDLPGALGVVMIRQLLGHTSGIPPIKAITYTLPFGIGFFQWAMDRRRKDAMQTNALASEAGLVLLNAGRKLAQAIQTTLACGLRFVRGQ